MSTRDQVNASPITKITSWFKFLGKNHHLVVCATVCAKSEVMLINIAPSGFEPIVDGLMHERESFFLVTQGHSYIDTIDSTDSCRVRVDIGTII